MASRLSKFLIFSDSVSIINVYVGEICIFVSVTSLRISVQLSHIASLFYVHCRTAD
jgi:hypothetical protein